METTERIYKGKDVEMLSATATITEHAIDNKTFLISKRTTWADPFFAEIENRIDDAFKTYLGIDNAKAMREATKVVLSIQALALFLLAEFKVQIEEDFKGDPSRRDEILTQLGITEHHKDAQNKDQEALIELLMKFKLNMTSTLQTEITTKGTALALIDNIIAQADILNNANITQETLKGGRKEISAEAVTEFNAIYSAVISVARIARNFFKKDPAKADLFSYNKTLRNLNRPTPEEEPPAPPEA